MNNHEMVKISFQHSGASVMMPMKSLITDAMVKAGIILPLDCGGHGTCGRCRVLVSGDVSEPDMAEIRLLDKEQLEEGWRLACRTKVHGDLQVTVPEASENIKSSWDIEDSDTDVVNSGTPVIVSVECEIPVPTLEDPRSDLRRVLKSVADHSNCGGLNGSEADLLTADHFTAGEITTQIRRCNWHLNAFMRGSELVGGARSKQHPLGLAVDLGSTKIAAYLIDLENGKRVASKEILNPQISFGADVITRLQRAVSKPSDGQMLTSQVRKALDNLAGELVAGVHTDRSSISEMSLVGNSAMIHLLLGLPLAQLGSPPFVASLDQAIEIKTRELGLNFAPGAYLYLPPLIGGFVGSDNVAMIMNSDLDRPGTCRLGLDIGTNTEVVLTAAGNDKPLFIASAPSGPTFEGAHLSSGMRAMAGAIYRVSLHGSKATYDTIGGGRPAGVCGSGIIDATAEMLRHGIINRQGHLDRSRPEIQIDNRSIRYTLIPASDSANGREISVTQSDISQMQLAKAAVNATVNTLLSLAGLEAVAIEEILLAGSFGSRFDVNNARQIGLIPNITGAIYTQVGNAAGRGAQQMLNSREARSRAAAIPAMVQYIESAHEPLFNKFFARSLPFEH